jgi:hypothetical protein
MAKRLSYILSIIFVLFLFFMQAGCKESNRVNANSVPVSTKNCNPTTSGTDERIAVFKVFGGATFEIPRAYVGLYKFDKDCNVESMNMDVALIDGKLSPKREFDNSKKEISSDILKNVPSANLILYFPDAQLKPRSLRAIREAANCNPRFTIPELGIEYFALNHDQCKHQDLAPQFFFSDVKNHAYNARIYCGIPDKLESTDLMNINDLMKLNYIETYGCRGHGSINPRGNEKLRIGVNYQYINNRGLPHIDATEKIIRLSSELIYDSTK